MAFFSGWGASEWTASVEAAASQASTWLSTVGNSQGWSRQALSEGQAAITAAADSVGDDDQKFWKVLVQKWPAAGRAVGSPKSWDKLGATFAQAGNTAYTTQEGRDLGTVSKVVGDTVDKTLDDIGETAKTAKSYGPAAAAALVTLAVIVWAAT